jgi:hypothetical protein
MIESLQEYTRLQAPMAGDEQPTSESQAGPGEAPSRPPLFPSSAPKREERDEPDPPGEEPQP